MVSSIGVAPVVKRLCQCDEREGKGTGRDGLAPCTCGGRIVKTFIVEREGKGGSLVPLESRLTRL